MSKDTTYVQGGANFQGRSKKRLKELIRENPDDVILYDTSAFGSKFSGPASTLPEGITFIVVGPDPFNARDWYANVYRNQRGGLTVK